VVFGDNNAYKIKKVMIKMEEKNSIGKPMRRDKLQSIY
jgi:hypothetical protein